LIRLRVIFRGHVQGVYFRATAERIARDFAVGGFVLNEADGSVLLVAEGERDEVERFVRAVHAAKAANVRSVIRHEEAPSGEFREFTTRR